VAALECLEEGYAPGAVEGDCFRQILARYLHCKPDRLTKKYSGDEAIGKRVFTPRSCPLDVAVRFARAYDAFQRDVVAVEVAPPPANDGDEEEFPPDVD